VAAQEPDVRTGSGRRDAAPSGEAARTDPALVVLGVDLLLVAGIVFAYAQVGRFDFVNFDDQFYVYDNELVRAGLTVEGVRYAFGSIHAATWHPLTTLSHMLDCQVFGLEPGWHHLVNVLLHALDTVLLFHLVRRLTGRTAPSALVAAVFGFHPAHVESVAWISERKDVLSAFLFIVTLFAYRRYAERPTAGRYLSVAACLALGLLAKPMLVTLPLVLLLLDFWPLRRWAGRPGDVHTSDAMGFPPARLLLEKAPLLGLSLAASLVTVIVQHRGGAMVSLTELPLAARVANAAVSYVRYLRLLVWPSDLAVIHPLTTVPSWGQAVAAGGGLAVLTGLAWRLGRRAPPAAVGWLFYVVTLLPVIGVLQVGTQALANRYTYLPFIGLSLAVFHGVDAWLERRPRLRPGAAAVAVGLVAAMLLRARVEVSYWRSPETLFRRALEVTRDNHIAHKTLGDALRKEGRLDEAHAHYLEAVRLHPRDASALDALAVSLATRGEWAAAAERLHEAAGLPDASAAVLNNLGAVLRQRGRLEEAESVLRRALELEPGNLEATNNLAMTLGDLGRVEAALPYLRAVVRQQEDLAPPRYRLGVALARLGFRHEAEEQLRAALAINPDHEEARAALASLTGEPPGERTDDAEPGAGPATR
jgi:Flp pilus assembly protein TadD